MKWEELPLADRARLMAAAVKNGYTDIRSIREAYANYLNLKKSTGNRYAEGGDADEPEVVNLLDSLPVWKALENVDYEVIADPEFTREKTGAGSIEYFSADHPEGITYSNGYHRDHPMPGRDVILYNPNTNDEQDIRLDALHIMPKDPTYDALNSLYREAAREGDVAWTAEQRYKEDLEKYGPDNLDSREQYFNNEADGLLRNMFIQGTPEYIESKHYHPKKEELRQWNAHLIPYINRIEQYLRTGERPADILPELVVTDKKAYGGNLFEYAGKMQRPDKPIGGMKGFLNLLNKYKIPYIKTSDFRPDAMTKSGNPSWHSLKDQWGFAKAVDVVPLDGDFEKFMNTIYSIPEIVAYMKVNKIGGIEEFTPDVMAKTGARGKNGGKHVHFGYDKWGIQMRDNRLKLFDFYHPMQDITYADVQAKRKRTELTPEEKVLLNTSPQTSYLVQYADRNNPNYQKSELERYFELNPKLDKPSNPFAAYSMFTNLQNGSQQDNADWFTTMLALSPKTTPQQSETNSLYQLFAPQEDDYMYHGLNFAAYGGNLFPLGGYTNALDAINSTGSGFHYEIDGLKMNRLLAIDYINNHKNEHYVVNRYSTTASTAGKQEEEQNWQTLGADGTWIDNNEYHPAEGNLDEIIVTHPYTINNSLSQDRTYLQHTPIRDLTVTAPIDFTNTEQNMFHRRDVADADAYVREALSSDVVDNIYDYLAPSAWAGLADKALEGDYSFNQLFNPTYDNQGWVGLFGADQWAKEHPEEAFAINFGTDLVLPFGIKGIRRVGTAARNAATWEPVTKLNSSTKAIPNHKLAGVKLPPSVNKMVDSLHNFRSELNEYLTADNNVYRELMFMEHHPKITRFINELSLGDKAAGLYVPGKNSKEFLDFFRNKIQEANPEVEIPEFSDLKSLADWEESMALSKDPIKYTGEYGAYRLFKEQHLAGQLDTLKDIFNGRNPYQDGARAVEARLNNGGNSRILNLIERNNKLRNLVIEDAEAKGLSPDETNEVLKNLGLSVDNMDVIDPWGNTIKNTRLPYKTNSLITAEDLPFEVNDRTGFKYDNMEVIPGLNYWTVSNDGTAIHVNPPEDLGIVFSKNQAYNKLYDIGAHEFAHAKYPSVESYANWLDESIFPNTNEYFSLSGATEIAARGTQIKNALQRMGMWRDGQPITANMLKSIRRYVIRNEDNNMTEFFSKIKDWDAAADWITKYAPSVAVPAGIGYGITQSD